MVRANTLTQRYSSNNSWGLEWLDPESVGKLPNSGSINRSEKHVTSFGYHNERLSWTI